MNAMEIYRHGINLNGQGWSRALHVRKFGRQYASRRKTSSRLKQIVSRQRYRSILTLGRVWGSGNIKSTTGSPMYNPECTSPQTITTTAKGGMKSVAAHMVRKLSHAGSTSPNLITMASGYLRGTVDELLVTTRQFIGLNNPQKWAYGQWLSGTKTLKVAGSKRVHIPANCAACALNLPMDEVLHDLTSNPLYGGEDSLKHPLPWLDDEPLEDTEEMMKITNDAISKWETSGRHIPEDSLEGIPW